MHAKQHEHNTDMYLQALRKMPETKDALTAWTEDPITSLLDGCIVVAHQLFGPHAMCKHCVL